MTDNPTLPRQESPTPEVTPSHQEAQASDEVSFSSKHVKYIRRFFKSFAFLAVFAAGSMLKHDKYYRLQPPEFDTLDSWLCLVLIFGAIFFFWIARATENLPQESAEPPDRVQVAEELLEASLAQRPPAARGSADESSSHLALASLWSLTHARLQQYHGIALGQAKKSFRNAQGGMLIGFALLVGFTTLALKAESAAASAAAAVLGSVSAALAGFVSRTFIRSQESAAAHLQRYFDQPLEFSRYLAAERLIVDSKLSDEQRAEVLTTLVQAMIAGPSQEPQAADSGNLSINPGARG